MAVILAGTGLVLSGAASAAGRQVVQASLEYTCRAPAGWQPIPAQVTVGIPGTATAGQPIRPTAPAITVTLPRADGEHLAELNASKVSLTAQVRGEAAAERHVCSRPLAAQGGVRTSARPRRPGASGARRGPAGHRHAPRGTSPSPPPACPCSSHRRSPTGPPPAPHPAPPPARHPAPPPARHPAPPPPRAPMRLGCVLNPGQTATLATVPVVAAAGPAAAAPRTFCGHFTHRALAVGPRRELLRDH